MPERIQRRRVKGFVMPAAAIYVGRPSKWGNPIRLINGRALVDHHGDTHYTEPGTTARELAVRLYREALVNDELPITTDDVVDELAGHDLACWCAPGQPCHADVLLYVANSEVFL